MNYKDILINRFHNEKEYGGDSKLINNLCPFVSISIATYQHSNYISKCIEGVLMQKTDFPFEIIIGEDGSADGTREICIKYAEKYPDKIRLFLRDRSLSNLYDNDVFVCRFNGLWNRMSARGKYIAICEGDDYWTDIHKLQKQVDFLQANEDFGMVHTNYNVLYNSRNIIKHNTKRNVPFGNVFENLLIDGNHIATLTILAKTDIIKESDLTLFLPSIINKWKMGDLPLWLEISRLSKIKYINDNTSVYRILLNSLSQSPDTSKHIDFIKSSYDIRRWFCMKYHKEQYLSKINNDEIYELYLYTLKKNHQDKKLYREKVRRNKLDNKNIIKIVLKIASINMFSELVIAATIRISMRIKKLYL